LKYIYKKYIVNWTIFHNLVNLGTNDDCRGNRRTPRKPAQRHFVPPQIPHS
jgi:hypothetical protein